jgi:surfeit locus 1 family protein
MSRSSLTLTAATLVALALLISLGIWQMERREWKNALIARLEAGLAGVPRPYTPGLPELSLVRLTGIFRNGPAVKLLTPTPEAARTKTQEGFGYQLFTPMEFPGGIVFVNRGFVPQSLAEGMEAAPPGESDITGLVRPSRARSWFMPPPELAKHVFFDADIPAMAGAVGLGGGRLIAGEYIQAAPVSGAPDWPMPADPRALLAGIPNRHLEYALTWLGLAATLAGVYAAYVLRR